MNIFLRFFLPLTLLSSFFSSESYQSKTSHSNYLYHSPDTNFWKEIKEFENKGLYGTALGLVVKYEGSNINRKNWNEALKALMYRTKYHQSLEEEPSQFIYELLLDAVKTYPQPYNNVIHSVLSDFLANSIISRNYTNKIPETDLTEFDNKIQDWNRNKFKAEITKHLLASINLDKDKDIALTDISYIVYFDKDAHVGFGKLSQILQLRTLEIFQKLNPYNIFENIAYTDEDAFDTKKIYPAKSLNIYNQIKEGKMPILEMYGWMLQNTIDLGERTRIYQLQLNWASQAFPQSHNKLYKPALINLEKTYSSHPFSAFVLVDLAQLQLNDTENSLNKNYILAFELLQKAKKRNPKVENYGAYQSVYKHIFHQSLSIIGERYYLPNQENLLAIKFRNFKTLNVYVYALDKVAEKLETNAIQKELKSNYSKIKPLQTFKYDFQLKNNYVEHLAEFLLTPLNQGAYRFFVVGNEGEPDAMITTQIYEFSNLMLNISSLFDQTTISVHDAVNGEIRKNAKVEIFEVLYNKPNKKITIINTGNEGFVNLRINTKNRYNSSYEFNIISGKDSSRLQENIYLYEDYEEKANTKHTIFTDRSIYKPGQKVYYKIISHYGKNNQYKVNNGEKISTVFYDANYQKIGEENKVTNDMGSTDGIFIIPENVLSGQFTIQTSSGSASIRVEEYKRAAFEIKLNQPEAEAKLDQKISIEGVATAFSGAQIDGASGNFTITRKSPWRWWDYSQGDNEQIDFGTFTTDSQGKFKIEFIAKTPENNFNKNRFYQYQINVNITDAAGETRTSNISISAADVPFQIEYSSKTVLQYNDKNILIKTQTLAGKPTNTTLKIEVEKVLNIDKIRPSRPWGNPDIFFKDSTYLTKNAIYQHPSLEKSEIIKVHQTPCEGEVEIDLEKLKINEQGSYILKITATQNGISTETSVPVSVIRKGSNKTINNEPLYVYQGKDTYEPGEIAELILSTPVKNAKIFYQIESGGKIENQEWLSLSAESKMLKVQVKENHRGGIFLTWVMVYNNRVYSQKASINVPYSNKKLKIELLTLKEKFAPGAEETFTLKISGFDSKVELLASMYDKMLDTYTPHQWSFFPYYSKSSNIRNFDFYGRTISDHRGLSPKFTQTLNHGVPKFNWIIQAAYYYDYFVDGISLSKVQETRKSTRNQGAKPLKNKDANFLREEEINSDEDVLGNSSPSPVTGVELLEESKPNFDDVEIRTNFNETAFFFPQISIKDTGAVSFTFKLPESLSRWKMQLLAHTKDVKTGILTHEIVTQKDLMVQSYAPRFLRDGDSLIFTAKIVNLSENDINTNVKLKLENIITGEEIAVKNSVLKLDIAAGKTEQTKWNLKIGNISGLRYTIIAQSENHSDAEQGIIPILPNKSIVIKTLAFYTEAQSKSNKIKFEGNPILSNKKNEVLNYTIEYTPNPAWYVVASLPYLTEYPYECAEQTFHRIYAVKLAEKIFSQNPALETMLKTWEKLSPDVLTSNLEKNSELKTIALEETNWVQKAQNETATKKKISLLADANHRKNIYDKGIKTLNELQLPSGAWPWFKGMQENLYITQVILAGEGRLRKLGMGILSNESVNRALIYCDNEYLKTYKDLFELKSDTSKYITSPTTIHYFYTQSFFSHKIDVKNQEALSFFYNKAKQNWLQYNEYSQAMLSIATHRRSETSFAKNIMASLKERAIVNPEMGMYWRSFNQPRYYWYQSNIESAAMLALAFEEVSDDKNAVILIQKYLLNNKRTNSWDNTKSTADACYVFISGNKNITTLPQPKIKIGNVTVDMKDAQPGTGYIKKSFSGKEVKSEMFEIEIENNSDIQGWGGVFLKYEAPADEVTANSSRLVLRRELFIVRTENKGEKLISLKNDQLKPGDKLECRLTFSTDREMEYVHLRDPRAGNTEPEYSPSGYRYKDGVSYYFSIKDAATNFFISKLYKGQYTLSYRMFITHEGDFSIAPATLQSMYAPEFSSNSEGRRLVVD